MPKLDAFSVWAGGGEDTWKGSKLRWLKRSRAWSRFTWEKQKKKSIVRRRRRKEGEDRCFLSVLLFNYRNNGRFPFQLIILLVSRPHCTRTGRDKLIVGIVLKYTWYSGICYVKRYPQRVITLTVDGKFLKHYVTPTNNAGIVCEVYPDIADVWMWVLDMTRVHVITPVPLLSHLFNLSLIPFFVYFFASHYAFVLFSLPFAFFSSASPPFILSPVVFLPSLSLHHAHFTAPVLLILPLGSPPSGPGSIFSCSPPL